MKEISDESDFAKSELIKKQLENTNKIKELRRRLNQGGNGEEERAYRWGGENRFHADKRKRTEAHQMEVLDEAQMIADAQKQNTMYASDLFHAKLPRARGKSRTPNVWNQLINPESGAH